MKKNINVNNVKHHDKKKNHGLVLLFCASLLLITFAAFAPTLKNDFVNWDDNVYVLNNSDIQGFSLHNIASIFSSEYAGNYQPITMLVYMVEYQFFQLNPSLYHAINLILHAINALLVFALIYVLSKNSLAGFIAAVLFAVNPLRVESVAWIAELKDVLAAFFYLLAILLYIRFIDRCRLKYYLLCAIVFIVSLMSKPVAVSLPVILFVVDYLRNRKIDRKSIINKLPFFAVAGIFSAITLITQKTAATDPGHISYTLSTLQRIGVPFYGVAFYAVKSILPFNLCSYYPFSEVSSGHLNMYLYTAVVVVAGIAAAIFWLRNRSRIMVGGSLFYIITLLPMLQIVPVGGAVVAERYAYIPSIGLYFIFAMLCGYLLKKYYSNITKGILAAIFLVYIAGLCYMTNERCGIWKDSISLWTDVIDKHPCELAHNNRGLIYGQKEEYLKALSDFSSAISLNPKYAMAFFNRGNVFRHIGQLDYSIEDYTNAIILCPTYTYAYYYRGISFCFKGGFDRGIADFSQTIALDPKNGEVFYNRGLAYEKKNDMVNANMDYNKARVLGYNVLN